MSIKQFKIKYQKDNKNSIILLSANSISELRDDENYPKNVISIKEIKQYQWNLNKKNISKDEVLYLFNEINIMLQAGLTLQESLEILLSKYSQKTQEYSILESMLNAMKHGIPIINNLTKYKNCLGDLVLSFIKLGEENGNIKYAINSLCIVLSKEQANKKKLLSKLSYPFLLSISLIIAISIIFIFVIPNFEHMFKQLGASLPIITQWLLQIKVFLFEYIYSILFISIFVPFVIWLRYKKSLKFKYNIDKILLLKIPVISNIIMVQQMFRFFLVLKVLIESGYKLQEALTSSRSIISNKYFLNKIEIIDKALKRGKDINTAFSIVEIFDPFTTRLIFAGEKSNDMLMIMQKLEVIYEQRLENSVKKISSIIEPALIAIIGLIILFVMLAIFLPIWQIGTVLS